MPLFNPDFTLESDFDKENSFERVLFGKGVPVLEVELNEMQQIQNEENKKIIRNIAGEGFLEKGTVDYASGTLNINNSLITANGNIINITALQLSNLTDGNTVYLNLWEEVELTGTSDIYKYGNRQETVLTNNITDERVGEETSRRKQTQFDLGTTQEGDYSLEIGNIVSGSIELSIEENSIEQVKIEMRDEVQNLKDYNSEGFRNFIAENAQEGNLKPKGGVEFIPYNDKRINYDNHFFNTDYVTVTNSTISFDFEGTVVSLITAVNSSLKSLDVSIDGGTISAVTISSADIYSDYFKVELASGLTNSKHTIEITTTDNYEIYGFEVVQSTDRSSANNAGAGYIDSERITVSADTQSYNTPATGRCDLTVLDSEGNVSVVEGTDGNSKKAFRVEEDGLVSAEYIKDIPNWIKDKVNVWNSEITGDYITGWERLKGVGKERYIYTRKTDSAFYIGFVGTGVTWKTVSNGEYMGIAGVSIDGSSEQNIDTYAEHLNGNYRFDFDGLDFGYHELKIRNTGNTTGAASEIFIDAFDIHLPETPELPADTQPLAKVYPMPSPAEIGSANLPKRPTSAEEKGWVRYESDEGCRYVGSGWGTNGETANSNKGAYETNTLDDYVEFNFIGGGIRFITRLNDVNGIVEISIDGNVVSNVDTYGARSYQVVAYENTNLSFGKHTIKIRRTDNKNSSSGSYVLFVDAFEVHRPLYLEDIRNLSPIREIDTYNIEHKSRLKDPNASGKVGEQLDKLWKMDNVRVIELDGEGSQTGEPGIKKAKVSFFPNGELVLDMVLWIAVDTTSYQEYFLPAIFSGDYIHVTSAVSSDSSSNSVNSALSTISILEYTNRIRLRLSETYSTTNNYEISVQVKGRWY